MIPKGSSMRRVAAIIAVSIVLLVGVLVWLTVSDHGGTTNPCFEAPSIVQDTTHAEPEQRRLDADDCGIRRDGKHSSVVVTTN
jgi:hypothetical protein